MADLDNLIDQWSFGGITRELAQGSLTPNMNEPPTLGDKLLDLVASIRRDFVLTEVEATRRAGELRSNLRVAQEALEEDDPAVYRKQREAMMSALESGREPPRALAEVFTAEASLVANARIATLSQNDSASPFRDGLWHSLSDVGPAY